MSDTKGLSREETYGQNVAFMALAFAEAIASLEFVYGKIESPIGIGRLPPKPTPQPPPGQVFAKLREIADWFEKYSDVR